MAISPETQLDLYNNALTLRIGDEALSSLTDDSEARRVMDVAWGGGAAVRYILERGEWGFATRARQIEAGTQTPLFGYDYAMAQPSDLRRIVGFSRWADFHAPMTDAEYKEEGRYWFSCYDTFYVRYISDDGAYGFNSTGWTEHFKEAVALKLAYDACPRIRDSRTIREELRVTLQETLRQAVSMDNLADGVKFNPAGSWVRSRSIGAYPSGWRR